MTEVTWVKNRWGVKLSARFRNLMRNLTDREERSLEKLLAAEGECREPLIVWKEKNVLVDGYHRFLICERRQIPYRVKALPFTCESEAVQWCKDNQSGRRNLTIPELDSIAKDIVDALGGTQHGGQQGKGSVYEKAAEILDEPPGTIRRRVARATAADGLIAPLRRIYDAGELTIGKKNVKRLSGLPAYKQKEIHQAVQQGQFANHNEAVMSFLGEGAVTAEEPQAAEAEQAVFETVVADSKPDERSVIGDKGFERSRQCLGALIRAIDELGRTVPRHGDYYDKCRIRVDDLAELISQWESAHNGADA